MFATRVVPLVVLALLAPGAEACHLGPGIGGQAGFVTTPEGPVPARIAFPICEGPGTARITYGLPGAEVTESIPVTMTILSSNDRCLVGSCGFGPPVVSFSLSGEDLDLQGTLVNGVHYVLALGLAGTYSGAAAGFGAFGS